MESAQGLCSPRPHDLGHNGATDRALESPGWLPVSQCDYSLVSASISRQLWALLLQASLPGGRS